MIAEPIALLLGLALLVWSADKFVLGAASLARNLGMSPMIIGLTVVSLGTSAPEVLVSVTAATLGASGLAIGNALGSNIANIALVLGFTAIVAPIPVSRGLSLKELPILLLVTISAGLLLSDLSLSRWDGLILLVGLVVSLYLFVNYHPNPAETKHLLEEEEQAPHLSTAEAIKWFGLGLLLLIASSRALVWGAVGIAQSLGISDLVIGLTVVAVGTSLPELAASVASALKGHHDIALGNVIGSNIFNLLAVMSIPAVISPYAFASDVLWRDYAFMGALTLVLAFTCMGSIGRSSSTRYIGRIAGLCFVTSYLAYLGLLVLQSAG